MPLSRTLFLTGPRFNSLARMVAPLVVSPAADPLFPGSGLHDDEVSNPLIFGSLAADPTWTADLNLVDNWDMTGNLAGNLTFWQEANTGTGDVTWNATAGVGGGNGMRLVSGTGTATAFEDRVCVPGERLVLIASLQSDGTNALRVRVQNLENLMWLNGAGGWQVAQTHVFTHSGAGYADFGPFAFDVQSLADLLWPITGEVTLRVQVANDAAAGVTASADNVALWPATSWFSLHGHNAPPSLALELRRDSAAFAGPGTLETSPLGFRPTLFWATTSGVPPRTDRHWRFRGVGTPTAAWYQGEAVLGQYRELETAPSMGWSTRRLRDQVRARPALGRARVRQLGDHERRVLDFSFKDLSLAAFDQFWKEFMRRSGFGATAVVIAHQDTDPELALYGEVPVEFVATRQARNVHTRGLELVEDPFPSIVS